MNDRVLLVVNPCSGRGRANQILFDIINKLSENGKFVTVYPTRQKEATLSYIEKNACNFDILAVCGGDGTLNEAFNGLLRSGVRIPVGYIPTGSTNDFAASLGLPTDPVEAADVIANGTPFAYDVGVMNDTFFTYIACAGAFTEISYTTNQNLKNKIGQSAYFLNSIKSLASLRKTALEITTPEFSISGDYIFASFSNTRNAGVVLNFSSSNVSFDDGMFELLLIRMPRDLIDLSTLIKDLLN